MNNSPLPSIDDLLPAYREGLARSADRLLVLRRDPAGAGPEARAELRRIAHRIRGSGGTYGFPHVTAWAGVVDDAPEEHLIRRVDGFERALRAVCSPSGHLEPWGWLEWIGGVGSAGRSPDDGPLDRAASAEEGWARVASRAGVDVRTLLDRVARAYGLPSRWDPAPEELDHGVLRPDTGRRLGVVGLAAPGEGPHVLTSNPTDLEAELVLEHVLGASPRLVLTSPAALSELLRRV